MLKKSPDNGGLQKIVVVVHSAAKCAMFFINTEDPNETLVLANLIVNC